MLLKILIRCLHGERLEKATPYDYRMWFGFLFFFGLLMTSILAPARVLSERAGGMYLWVGAVIVVTAMVFGLRLWVKHVPAWISLALAVVTWAIVVWAADTF